MLTSVRRAPLLALVLVVAAACGGRVAEDGADQGGTARGGASGAAGTSSSPGETTADAATEDAASSATDSGAPHIGPMCIDSAVPVHPATEADWVTALVGYYTGCPGLVGAGAPGLVCSSISPIVQLRGAAGSGLATFACGHYTTHGDGMVVDAEYPAALRMDDATSLVAIDVTVDGVMRSLHPRVYAPGPGQRTAAMTLSEGAGDSYQETDLIVASFTTY